MILNPARWTLRSKLLVSIVTLFVVVLSLIAAATVLTTRNSLMMQVDEQLTDVQHAIAGPGGNEPHSPDGSGSHPRAPGLNNSVLRLTLDASSTSTSVLVDQNYVSQANGTSTTLTQNQIRDVIMSVRPAGGHTSVDLGGELGRYRLVAVTKSDGSTAYVGFPLEPVEHNVADLARNIALMGLLGLIAVGGASFLLVRRNLTPLQRVAATAERVSELPLGRGDVRTDERVPASLTDDHTEVGTVGSALNNLLDHVDSALDARHESEMQVRQFVADASHELRTPLASIRGYAELSRREKEPVPAGVTHALGRIESEAGRMTTLVEDLLLLARLDAGRELEREPVDLTRVVVETVSDLHAAGPDHVWHLDLPEELDDFPEVVGDEARLRQVVINLLANARRHTPAGTTVTTGLRGDGADVLVTVTDDGPGIPPEFMPHLFERFTRGDAARTRTEGSTGLGLSIVDAVVAAHHGTVRVESRPGRTCFTVSLPISASAAPTVHTGREATPRTGASSTVGG